MKGTSCAEKLLEVLINATIFFFFASLFFWTLVTRSLFSLVMNHLLMSWSSIQLKVGLVSLMILRN